jgi:hypothetical protein
LLAKVLDVIAPHFLTNTQFCFPLSSLLISQKEPTMVAKLVVYLPTVGATQVQFVNIFFVTIFVMALESIKCHLCFEVFTFIYFPSSSIHVGEQEEHSLFLNMQ